MQISLLAVGTRMPGWVQDGFNEYNKRLPPHLRIQLKEIAPIARSASRDAAKAISEEGKRLLKSISADDFVIALDEGGEQWTSRILAARVENWQQHSPRIKLLIGGADGLSAECKARAQASWSLSAATLPHGLVRVFVAEQLYRAWSITQGHPYHRD
ncbi:MAG: 23S rRNA (pseudouridine(1915)-N(3))-methyltransferase RlmH [Gammaproteobacteria bacterium]